MRPIVFSALLFVLCACSKGPQSNSSITLTIDGKTALSDKAEGSNLPQFYTKHEQLIDAVMAACEKRENIAGLRGVLEASHKMNGSAEIKIEKETVPKAGAATLSATKSNWKVTVGKETFSCSQSSSS